ncbi:MULTISPECIES: hypothetical protein [unclassified Moraxella]|uniref:hypothetical protein n=1 Tax=unclassified Moraxella TaxID=2685852 RepID=UPI002B417C63|nr:MULTISPECIES: hypothetical protein [unclassified Moraxella]
MSNIVKIQNVEHLTAMINAMVPRSFEKTFRGLSTNEAVAGFSLCVAGFSQTELNTGLEKIKEMGYCPDPAMFAKWCKGIDGFDNKDYIADSYIDKSGALANIIAWIDNPKSPISQAEKQAYDKTYHMFRDINSDFDKNQAYSAFKAHYEHTVNALIEQKQASQPYVPPTALQAPQDAPQAHLAVSNEQAKEFLAGIFGKLHKNPKNAQTMGLTA